MKRPKFQVQKATKDFSKKINHIVGSVKCEKHNARVEEPCWKIQGDNGRILFGVCANRTRRLYTGTPSERASTNKYDYKRKQKEQVA